MADQKHGLLQERNVADLAKKLCVALRVQRHASGVSRSLTSLGCSGWHPRHWHTRVPITFGYRPRRATELAPLNGKSLDFECSMSGHQVHAIAWPLHTDHAKVPLSILATMLEHSSR